MNKRYVVNDPENSDATFGPDDEAQIWIVSEGDEPMSHTGTAIEDGDVLVSVNISDLIASAVALFSSNEYSGNRAVVDSAALETLQLLLRDIGEDV